jgi:O-antigen ligase
MKEQSLSTWSRITGGMQLASCCLMAFSFPFRFNYTAICVWLLAIAWLLRADYRGTWQRLKSIRGLWPFILYFLLYALSYTYSDDKAQSAFDITQKLSFVLLPLLLGAGAVISRRGWERILLCFSLGISVAALFFMSRGLLLWQQSGDDECLFYHQLVAGSDANAVYMAWYTLFSLSALLIHRWTAYFRRWPGALLKWLMVALQLAFFILLSSRTMLVLLCVIVLPVYLLRVARRFRWSALRILAALALAAAAITAIVKTDNPVRQRFQDVMHNDMQHAFQSYYPDSNQQFTNLTLRVFVWRVGLENIEAHHLWWRGAGNGDVHVLQNERIASYGFRMKSETHHPAAMRDVDLHNMYLQTVMAIGIPGLVCLLVLMLSPFFFLRRTGERYLAFIFQVTACLFMLQEAVFQTQSGIIYYIFFAVLFWQFAYRKDEWPQAATDLPPSSAS